jgi:integrase
VASACKAWLASGEVEGLERSTREQRRQHVEIHIEPALGAQTKLSRIDVATFRDVLLRTRSRAMASKVMISLGSILKHAGMAHIGADVAAVRIGGRHKRPLEVGRDVPTPAEVRRLLDQANGYVRSLLAVLALCGLRLSEARGLRWADIDFPARRLHLRQRADRWGGIGPLKSAAAYRSIPLGPFALHELKTWRLQRPGQLVFGNGRDNVEGQANITDRHLKPLQVAAGVVDHDGKAKYGAHSFRHFCASAWIEHGFNLKRVSELLGHHSPVVTLRIYAHWLKAEDEHDKLAGFEAALLNSRQTRDIRS